MEVNKHNKKHMIKSIVIVSGYTLMLGGAIAAIGFLCWLMQITN